MDTEAFTMNPENLTQMFTQILSQMASNSDTTNQLMSTLLQQQQLQQQHQQQQNSFATNTLHSTRPKEKLPKLSEFDGARGKFLRWEMEARNKLSSDGESIGTPKEQLHYVFSCLRGSAGNMCLAFVKTEENHLEGSGTRLIDYLVSIYGNPHRQQAALDNLRTLQQGTKEPFWKFLPKFETELADAGVLEFSDTIKISYLRGALNRTMKERLVGIIPTPTEYHQYTTLLQQLGSQLDLLQQDYRTNAKAGNDGMDWEPTPIRGNKAWVHNSNNSGGSKHKQQAKWVSYEEIGRRKEAGSCLRCGKSNHFVKDCFLAPAKRPSGTQSPAVRNRRVGMEEISPEEESDDEGKE